MSGTRERISTLLYGAVAASLLWGGIALFTADSHIVCTDYDYDECVDGYVVETRPPLRERIGGLVLMGGTGALFGWAALGAPGIPKE